MNSLAALTMALLFSRAAAAGHNCDCLYVDGLPASVVEGSDYSDLPAVSAYGTLCAAWDSIPGTPWHSGSCAGEDWCTASKGWCDDPWCYVSPDCPSHVPSDVFTVNDVGLGYSYQACGGPANCYADNDAEGCPYDAQGHCDDPCACKYPDGLPERFAAGTEYTDMALISQYGVTCTPWDSLPGTPYHDSCDGGVDWCHRDHTWCAAPWCYVDEACPNWAASSVFDNADAVAEGLGYAYQSCNAPDCYGNDADGNPKKDSAECPYDWSGSCCQCKYAGGDGLPDSYWQNSEYADATSYPMIEQYGTGCVPWDSLEGTPWFSSCDRDAGKDWCSPSDDWCNVPWCYVEKSTCSTFQSSDVFPDATDLGYSYQVCGAIDCYNDPADPACPYDIHGVCPAELTYDQECLGAAAPAPTPADPCACIYLDGLPTSVWQGGQYESLSQISQYGATCAPWDSIADTPWYGSCDDEDHCNNTHGWCDDPWCYVSPSCSTAQPSDVFADNDVDLSFSYQACGSPADCYSDNTQAACPYDPTGKCEDPCKCKYLDTGLPAEFWTGGAHEAKALISQYGASCNTWDGTPGTPLHDSCAGAGADWCHRDNSWCALSWCYVDEACPTWLASDVFDDVQAAVEAKLGYSYTTCGSPDCYNEKDSGPCPLNWNGKCCGCVYQDGLPAGVYETSAYSTDPLVSSYGTQCAPWDAMKGTPWFEGSCKLAGTTKDWCSAADSWCNDPWCYVDKMRCNSWASSDVFPDATDLGFSYAACGAVDCYGDGHAEGCPYEGNGQLHHCDECAPTAAPGAPGQNGATPAPGGADDEVSEAFGASCVSWLQLAVAALAAWGVLA